MLALSGSGPRSVPVPYRGRPPLKVREGGRVAWVHALVATGINADGYREVLRVDVPTSEDGAGRLQFFRGLASPSLNLSCAQRNRR
jgi:hypothetical protein